MQKLKLNINGMQDIKCEGEIVDKLKKLDGIFLVKIDYSQSSGVITFDENKLKPIDIAKSIKSLGYEVTADIEPPVESSVPNPVKKKLNVPKIVFGAVAAVSLCVIALEMYAPSRNYIASHLQADKKTGLEVLQEQTKSTSTDDQATSKSASTPQTDTAASSATASSESTPKQTSGDIKSSSGTTATPESKTDTPESKADTQAAAPVVQTSSNAEAQKVTAEIGDGGKLPDITVKVGQPVEFNLHVKDASLITSGSDAIIIAPFQLEQNLNVGDNVIKFTPSSKGVFEYTSGDGNKKAKITVN